MLRYLVIISCINHKYNYEASKKLQNCSEELRVDLLENGTYPTPN